MTPTCCHSDGLGCHARMPPPWDMRQTDLPLTPNTGGASRLLAPHPLGLRLMHSALHYTRAWCGGAVSSIFCLRVPPCLMAPARIIQLEMKVMQTRALLKRISPACLLVQLRKFRRAAVNMVRKHVSRGSAIRLGRLGCLSKKSVSSVGGGAFVLQNK